jgi:hypothetical protein
VYSSTAADFLFPDNAGAIPTEVGQLAQLERLALGSNQLTGTPKKTSLIAKWYTSVPVPTSKKAFLLRRQHSDGIRLLHGTAAARPGSQQIDR